MSDAVAAFPIAVPANTSSPMFFPCLLGWADVEDILVVVPPGCAGLVGFQIWAGGAPAYPFEQGQYFVFDDYPYDQVVSNQINSGQWGISAYNNDTYQHTLRAYFRYNYVQYSPSLSLGTPVSV